MSSDQRIRDPDGAHRQSMESFINEVLRARKQAGVGPDSTTQGGVVPWQPLAFGRVCSPPIVASSPRPGWSEPSVTPVRDEADIEAAVSAFAREPGGGLIAGPDPFISTHRAMVIALAERHRLPAFYGARHFVRDGGLISYGPDTLDIVRRSAS